MYSLGDQNNVGDATFSKFAAIITTMELLLFMVPDGLITVSVWFYGNINWNDSLQASFSKLFLLIVVSKYGIDFW